MLDGMDAETARKSWLSLLAKADEGHVAELLDAIEGVPSFTWLRPPEIGSVMVRGRVGGSGEPFNLGEMTVTRCSLKIPSGEIGHGYVQGRNKDDARAAALTDALMQTAKADDLRNHVLAPLQQQATRQKTARAAKAAATKVDFFTLVRGED